MKRILSMLLAGMIAIPAMAATFGNGNGGPRTTNNDDTCDISVEPAATLLLPYFEVDTGDSFPPTRTTIFTITNVTNIEQIARVTLWTDYSFPVITFNIYLTGYDVQSINLFDVIVRGNIAPDAGTGTEVSPTGPLSDVNEGILDRSFCDRMPGSLDNVYVERMQNAFLEGNVPPIGQLAGCNTVGGVHEFATGYATIDVVGNCRFSQPNEALYFTRDIRYDNVFTGDYQQINTETQSAQMNPLVHIRAMPEGGTPESRTHGAHNRTNFPRTFYDRYAPAGYSDARQPLPSTFHARWIEGGPQQYQTFYKIWREGVTGSGSACAEYPQNAALPVREIVVFDDAENFVVGTAALPETSRVPIADSDTFPQLTNGATAGWTYFNLDTVAGDGEATQNWVVVSMESPLGYGGDFDATALGNGCSPEAGTSEASGGSRVIGPAPNEN
ncbi:MAG TPA: hypothetical protein VGD79_12345 [Thermoanaerobaculia bacterium]|jgi:hypothetical protein